MSETGLWYHKYRPTTLEGYVWKDEHLKSKLEEWMEDPTSMPNLILAGPPGTGKTTLSLMIQDLLELDESDYLFINCTLKRNSSIEVIRNDITDHCENGGWGGIKVVVIDESNRLSHAAQESLKGVMDAYGAYTRFIFTTNHIRKMDIAVLSRARTINMDTMDKGEYTDRVVEVARSEGVFGDDPQDDEVGALIEIVEKTYPDLRKGIDLLQFNVKDGKVTAPGEDEVIDAEWITPVLDTVNGNTTVDGLRQILVGLRPEDIEDVYRFLYEHITEICPEKPEDAVMKVAEYLDRHVRSVFPDLTLAALLFELQEL